LRGDDPDITPQLLLDEYEERETEVFANALREGNVVLDIGACFGHYTLLAARLVKSPGRVFSFEPDPENFRLLLKNIEANGYRNVVPLREAVSDRPGRTRLFLHPKSAGTRSISNSNVREVSGSIVVQLTTVDRLVRERMINRVDFMKIDVLGAEGLVIKGAKETLSRFRPRILMEFWPKGLENLGCNPLKLLRQLRRLGFTITVIDNAADCPSRVTDCNDVMRIIESTGEGMVNIFLTPKCRGEVQ